MSIVELRDKILQFVSHADENRLKELEAFIKMQGEASDLSEEDKRLLDERLKQHQAHPEAGKSWDELKAELKSKYGL
ncbi:MAG: addiction module family protein [Owenweeksia sp.]|nr:addiction module family protein [Owenweeksia sp.]